MKASVYISSKKIYVLKHVRGKVKDISFRQLPEGSIINGLITDPAQVIECLSDLRRENPRLLKSAVLVVDGSSVLVKRLEVPKLSRRQYDRLIRHDFAHSTQSADDLICGYQLLPEGAGGSAILACAADVALVDSYIDTFRAAGIELEAIHIGIQAILNYVAGHRDLAGKTFILNVVDGLTLLSVVFEKGKSVLIQRSRLYGEEDAQMAENIRDNLARLRQFARSENLSDITDSYYLGISDEALDLIRAQNIFTEVRIQKLNIDARLAGGEPLPDDAHFVYLNTQLSSTGIDLIQGRRERAKRRNRERPKRYWLFALIALTLILASLAAVFLIWGLGINAQNNQIQAHLDSPSVAQATGRINRLERENMEMAEVLRQHDELTAVLDGLVPASDELVNLILNAYSGYVDITSFDYIEATGILYINGSCLGETVAARYVSNLRKSDLISEIDYTGYSYRSTGEYDFSIAVTLYIEQEVE